MEPPEDLHRRARDAAELGRHAEARRLLRRALRSGPDPEWQARILISLAFQEAERANLEAGLALLDEADAVAGVPVRVHGLVHSQRGLLYSRAGEHAAALVSFEAALAMLDETVPEDLCRALLNASALHLRGRNLRAARHSATACAEVAARHGLSVIAAKARHNLGYLLMLAGDLPKALREMDAAGVDLVGQAPVLTASCAMDRAQALLAAALLQEADEELRQAQAIFGANRMRQLQAEAELSRARVATAEDRWGDARHLARQARQRFIRRGATVWALLAEHALLVATVGSGRRLRTTGIAAEVLAERLRAAGMPNDARQSALVAAMVRVRLHDPAGARVIAAPATVLRGDDPIDTRLQSRVIRAVLAEAAGEPRRMHRELRTGLAELQRYQSLFGSIDMQTAVSGLGRRLAERGLAQALRAGRPAAIFGWAERARALSSRLPPVVPPSDDVAAEALNDLRYAQLQLRQQQLAGAVDPLLQAHHRDLQRMLRRRSWYRSGPGRITAPAPLSALQAELERTAATFVAHIVSEGRLHALVVDAQRRTVHTLGSAGDAVEAARRLRADLDLLAAIDLPPSIRSDVEAAYRTQLRRVDKLLFEPIADLMRTDRVLLAPGAVLATVPWTLLPTLAGRPLSVVASATAWLGTRDRAMLPDNPTVALAAGPRLDRAADEVASIARVWPAATVLTGPAAVAHAVRDAASGVDLLHVAAHGVHEPNNPLFSYLELADGPLFGHELDQLPSLPTHLVLSACRLGLATSRAGDETLGMTAALLHAGAASVVASVALIADEVADEVAVAHHTALRAGVAPAVALATAIGDRHAPLVCFGVGW